MSPVATRAVPCLRGASGDGSRFVVVARYFDLYGSAQQVDQAIYHDIDALNNASLYDLQKQPPCEAMYAAALSPRPHAVSARTFVHSRASVSYPQWLWAMAPDTSVRRTSHRMDQVRSFNGGASMAAALSVTHSRPLAPLRAARVCAVDFRAAISTADDMMLDYVLSGALYAPCHAPCVVASASVQVFSTL